jgi:hypothetical protein
VLKKETSIFWSLPQHSSPPACRAEVTPQCDEGDTLKLIEIGSYHDGLPSLGLVIRIFIVQTAEESAKI